MSIRKRAAPERYTIYEGARPVLTYNFGTVPVPPGVGGRYAVARSDYVHELYGPDGEVLTKDYSPDHPHHRGIYWAWPEVSYKGQTRDLHALQGVYARPVRIVRRETSADHALIEAENVWKWGDREPIVREFVTIRASRWREGAAVVDLSFRFVALVDGVALARRGRDTYGGLNIRLSARARQKITCFTDPPELPTRRAWAELSGIPPGGTSPVGVAVLQSAANPRYPGDWVQYPDLNWLQPTFPSSGEAFALERDRPLELSYRLVVHEGEWGPERLSALWSAYNPQKGSPFAALATYRFGESRRALVAVERLIARAGPGERRVAGTTSWTRLRREHERELTTLLADDRATLDVKRWACRQLERIGTSACVGALEELLGAAETCSAACGALQAIPGDEADAALVSALGRLDGPLHSSQPVESLRVVQRVERLVQVAGAVGQRRIERAVPRLARLARSGPRRGPHDAARAVRAGGDRSVPSAAIDALGKIGCPAAARALAETKAPAELASTLVSARLQCAQRLNETGHAAEAAAICLTIIKRPGGARPSAWQRSAALIGLARANRVEAVPRALSFLREQDRRLQGAAAAVLTDAPGDVSRALADAMSELPRPTQVVVLRILADRGDASVSPAVAALVGNESEDVQLAAIEALGVLGNADHVALLAGRATRRGAVGRKAADALRRLKGEAVGKAIQKLALSGRSDLSPVLAGCMASRRDPGAVQTLFRLAKSGDDATVKAACSALGKAADPGRLGDLLKLLKGLPAKHRREAGRSIIAVCSRADDREERVATVLKALESSSAPVAVELLRLLPSLGGERALQAVRRAMKAEDATIRGAAGRALTKWRYGHACPDLLEIIRERGTTRELRILAIRGLARLSESPEIEPGEKLGGLTQALGASERPEERKVVISALGKLKDPGAVQLLATLLDDEKVRIEAATAIAAASLPHPGSPGLEGKPVRSALRRARTCLAGTPLGERVEEYLAGMASGPNLARGRPVRASHPHQGNLRPELAVDGTVSQRSYWSCAHTPSWLQVDLGRAATIDGIRLYTYWDGTRYYQYTIDISTDGAKWRQVVDRSANTVPADPDGESFKIGPLDGRYVRVTMLKNSANPGVHIVEIQVFETGE